MARTMAEGVRLRPIGRLAAVFRTNSVIGSSAHSEKSPNCPLAAPTGFGRIKKRATFTRSDKRTAPDRRVASRRSGRLPVSRSRAVCCASRSVPRGAARRCHPRFRHVRCALSRRAAKRRPMSRIPDRSTRLSRSRYRQGVGPVSDRLERHRRPLGEHTAD